MRLSVFVAITLLAFAAGQSSVAQSAGKDNPQPSHAVAEHLVGAWRLVSIETIRVNGEVIYPFYGKHPEGMLMYDRSGWMSVQIVSEPKPTQPTADSREDFLKARAAEKVEAIDGYYTYCGTWSIDPVGSTVTHHIKQSLDPGERGKDGVRHFVLDGNRLTLTAKTHEMGEDHMRKLVWERAPAQN